MKLLITGASGFIGKRLVSLAREEYGYSIVSLGQLPCGVEGVPEILAEDITSVECENAILEHRPDALVHLAGAGVNPSDRDIGKLLAVNAILPAQMVDLASRCGIRAVVLSGSCSEYAPMDIESPLPETAPLETAKLYGTTKAAGGMLALSVGVNRAIPVCVARIFNAYGFGEAEYRLLPTVFRHLLADTRASLSTGSQVRDFIHIDDICEGLLRFSETLLSNRNVRGAYNLCTGVGVSVKQMAQGVARLLEKDESLLGFGDIPLRPDDAKYLVGDVCKTRELLGWTPSITIDDGIRRFYAQKRGIQ